MNKLFLQLRKKNIIFSKEHVNYNPVTGSLEAKYPFNKDPAILVDNRNEAKACQVNQKKRQIKTGTHEEYPKQFKDMFDRNILTEITKEEMETYKGPVNYITHHKVYKPDSLSTPVCVVSNSTFKNGKTNLNDLTVKGPNTLADIYDNLIKFKSYKDALVYDITNAYNSIKTGLAERHLRRLWYRESPEQEWKIYGFNCVQFGDKCAGTLMTIAVERAAETFAEVASDLG